MIIGHAIAIWDLAVKYGAKSSSAETSIVSALNRARFGIPVIRSKNKSTTGKVTETALQQWRKRARSLRGGPYAEVYRAARENLDQLLKRIHASQQADVHKDLIDYLEKFAEAHRVDD